MLKNKIWIIQFLLRKKCSWYVGIILIMYLIVIPYQINLIEFFESKENAKNLFWKSAYLYHNVFVLTFVFFSSMQLLNSEMREIFAKEKKQNSLYSFGNIWHIPTYSVADIYMVFNDISR